MARRVRIVVLNDNEPGPGLINDWGWSAYIEADDVALLFDANTSPKVIEYNARKLGVDFSNLGFAVLSHHHGDHYGGFEYVGEVKNGLPIYVPPGDTSYLRSMGLKPIIVEGDMRVTPGIWIVGPLRSSTWGVYEQALAVDIEDLGLLVVVGCSHPGADALASRAATITGRKVYWVVGGYHEPPYSVLDNLIILSEKISPAHCSGEEAKRYVRRKAPGKYVEVRTGTTVELDSSGMKVIRK